MRAEVLLAKTNHRDISLADPRLQLAWAFLLQVWTLRHPYDPVPFLSQVFRSAAMQNAYFAQGRKPLADVNNLRQLAGLAPLTAAENKRKVTNAPAGRSKHERKPAEAIDLAFVKAGTKRELDWNPRLFKQAAVIMREYDPGLVWGGDWDSDGRSDDEKFIDFPHIQT